MQAWYLKKKRAAQELLLKATDAPPLFHNLDTLRNHHHVYDRFIPKIPGKIQEKYAHIPQLVEEPNRLDSFAQAHLVCQDGRAVVPPVPQQPIDALILYHDKWKKKNEKNEYRYLFL